MEFLKNLNSATVIQIFYILFVTWLSITLTQKILLWLAEKFSGQYRSYSLALVPILRLLILGIAFSLVISRIIEPTFENLLALLGALGLALGFAFKDYISSLIAGIVVLYELPYRPGDWITVEGVYGKVKSINMRALQIVTPDDTLVTIPHLKIWNSPILNSNDGSRNLLCVAKFYLEPYHDAQLVKNILYDVALTSPLLQISQPINVAVRETQCGTYYQVKAYPINPEYQFDFLTDLTIRAKTAFVKLNIAQITFPNFMEKTDQL